MVMPVPKPLEQEQNGGEGTRFQIKSFLQVFIGVIDLVFMINGDKVRQMTTMARGQNKVNCTKPIPS
jgi:hypothetical protein